MAFFSPFNSYDGIVILSRGVLILITNNVKRHCALEMSAIYKFMCDYDYDYE